MRRVRDLMQRQVVTITPQATVGDLVRTLEEEGASEAAVVDCLGNLLGAASVREVLELTMRLQDAPSSMRWGLAVVNPLGTGSDPGDGGFFPYYVTPSGSFVDVRDRVRELPGDTLQGYSVARVMKGPPVTIVADAGLPELARLLRKQSLGRALVVDGRKLVGTVSTADLLEGLWGGVPYEASAPLSELPPAVGCR